MRNLAILLSLIVLGACASQPQTKLQPSESGGSRAEGIVTLSSTTTLFSPAGPDWTRADAGAAKRCRSWGYDRASSFTGSQEICRRYDRHGRCVVTTTTRFYECQG